MMNEHVVERCPLCNSGTRRDEPEYGKGAYSFSCGTVFRSNGDVVFRWGACVGRAEKWLRRQLAQAQTEVECLRRERASVLSILRDPTRSYSAKVIEAVDLFDTFGGDNDKEGGVDDVTHFALYHPDLNWWECQADDCHFLWEFEDSNPYEDGMSFCPRCGRRIVRAEQQKHS